MLNGRRADVRLPLGVAISVEAFNKLISIVFYGNYNYQEALKQSKEKVTFG